MLWSANHKSKPLTVYPEIAALKITWNATFLRDIGPFAHLTHLWFHNPINPHEVVRLSVSTASDTQSCNWMQVGRRRPVSCGYSSLTVHCIHYYTERKIIFTYVVLVVDFPQMSMWGSDVACVNSDAWVQCTFQPLVTHLWEGICPMWWRYEGNCNKAVSE